MKRELGDGLSLPGEKGRIWASQVGRVGVLIWAPFAGPFIRAFLLLYYSIIYTMAGGRKKKTLRDIIKLLPT